MSQNSNLRLLTDQPASMIGIRRYNRRKPFASIATKALLSPARSELLDESTVVSLE
jgi:hypothetical protein